MPASFLPPVNEASRPGGPGGPDPACLRDGYVFDRVSGFHWHPYASHWFQPTMGIFLSPKGDLLDAGESRRAAVTVMAEVASSADADPVPMAAISRLEDALPEVEIGLGAEAGDDDSFDLPALAIDHDEPPGAAAGGANPSGGGTIGKPSATIASEGILDDIEVEGVFEASESIGVARSVQTAPGAYPSIDHSRSVETAPDANPSIDHARSVETAPGANSSIDVGTGAAAIPVAGRSPGSVAIPLAAPSQGSVAIPVGAPAPGGAAAPPTSGSGEGLVERPIAVPVARASASSGLLDPAAIPASFAEAWRVVIHLRSGSSKRGELKGGDLHSRSVVLHHAAGVDPVDTESIKAIFFMREAHVPARRPTGSRVRITFADGRPLEGFAPRKLPSSGGFFVLPADDRTNTAWIFVYPQAIKDLAFG